MKHGDPMKIVTLALILFAMVVLWSLVIVGWDRAEACRSYGYPQHAITLQFQSFCIKGEGKDQIVVPLAHLQ